MLVMRPDENFCRDWWLSRRAFEYTEATWHGIVTGEGGKRAGTGIPSAEERLYRIQCAVEHLFSPNAPCATMMGVGSSLTNSQGKDRRTSKLTMACADLEAHSHDILEEDALRDTPRHLHTSPQPSKSAWRCFAGSRQALGWARGRLEPLHRMAAIPVPSSK